MMTNDPEDWPEDDVTLEELLALHLRSERSREVLLADEVRQVDIDPHDPSMIFPIDWPTSTLSHAVVRFRSPEGIAMQVVESWAPSELVDVATLADCDVHDLIPWFIKDRQINPRRAREQIYVMRRPARNEADLLEVFADEPIVRRGRWLFDGNDSLLLVQRNIMRPEALLIYERDLEFETILPPAFVVTPQPGTGG
jgi:DNA-binding GntR family transcriptional regulator